VIFPIAKNDRDHGTTWNSYNNTELFNTYKEISYKLTLTDKKNKVIWSAKKHRINLNYFTSFRYLNDYSFDTVYTTESLIAVAPHIYKNINNNQAIIHSYTTKTNLRINIIKNLRQAKIDWVK